MLTSTNLFLHRLITANLWVPNIIENAHIHFHITWKIEQNMWNSHNQHNKLF